MKNQLLTKIRCGVTINCKLMMKGYIMFAELNAYKEHLANEFAHWSRRPLFSYPEEGKEEYAARIEARIAEFSSKIKFEEGNKFIKVIVDRSAHSFIVKNDDDKFKAGDILKAASWKAPAKNFSRGNIFKNNYDKISWAGC